MVGRRGDGGLRICQAKTRKRGEYNAHEAMKHERAPVDCSLLVDDDSAVVTTKPGDAGHRPISLADFIERTQTDAIVRLAILDDAGNLHAGAEMCLESECI